MPTTCLYDYILLSFPLVFFSASTLLFYCTSVYAVRLEAQNLFDVEHAAGWKVQNWYRTSALTMAPVMPGLLQVDCFLATVYQSMPGITHLAAVTSSAQSPCTFCTAQHAK